MAYQCHKCSGWTADTQNHSCIYDEMEELRSKLSHILAVLRQIELDTRNISVCKLEDGTIIECNECVTTNGKVVDILDKFED